MSNIKPLDKNEKTVTTLAIIGGLLLFFLALTKCENTSEILSLNNNDTPLSELSSSHLNPDELSELKRENNEAQDSIDMLQSDLSAKENEIDSLQNKLATTEKENNNLQEKINRLKSSSAPASPNNTQNTPSQADSDQLNQLKASLQEAQEKNKDLSTQNTELTNQITALDGAAKGRDAEIDELKRKIQGLNTERDALFRTKQESEEQLKGEINKLSSSIKTGENNDVIKQEVAKVEEEWKKKLDDLKVKHEMDKAKSTNALKSELNNLRVALRKEKTKKVFANSSEDLAPTAQNLIKNLNDYKGESQADLDNLYKNINTSLKSTPKLVVNFASGSSSLTEEYQNKVTDLITNAKPDSYFIAVGYADTTGSASANKSLSSKRATKVAETVKPNLKENQFVQAYYLGQTERFGAPENNRIVEIWEINE